MLPQDQVRTMSGISKRLFVALSDFRGDPPQLEDALFQLASVIDATSKSHYPGEKSSKRRFVDYLDSQASELFRIATSGMVTMHNCRFADRNGSASSLGEIVYGIRCSSYHDPEEVNQLILWGNETEFGGRGGRFIINKRFLMALFLILLSDPVNRDRIDRALFDDQHFLVVDGVRMHPLYEFIGNRSLALEIAKQRVA